MTVKEKILEQLPKVDSNFVEWNVDEETIRIKVKSFSAFIDDNFTQIGQIISKEMSLRSKTEDDAYVFKGSGITVEMEYSM